MTTATPRRGTSSNSEESPLGANGENIASGASMSLKEGEPDWAVSGKKQRALAAICEARITTRVQRTRVWVDGQTVKGISQAVPTAAAGVVLIVAE